MKAAWSFPGFWGLSGGGRQVRLSVAPGGRAGAESLGSFVKEWPLNLTKDGRYWDRQR